MAIIIAVSLTLAGPPRHNVTNSITVTIATITITTTTITIITIIIIIISIIIRIIIIIIIIIMLIITFFMISPPRLARAPEVLVQPQPELEVEGPRDG